MIPDVEIQERLSVDFAFDRSFQPDVPEKEEDEEDDDEDDDDGDDEEAESKK
jgi:hypothetical protein